MSPASTTTWTGWYRASEQHPWRKVCEATDYGTAWDLLLALDVRGDKLVSMQDPSLPYQLTKKRAEKK